jgi:hypothetical protein
MLNRRMVRTRTLAGAVCSPTNTVLIAYPLYLAVLKVNLEHIFAGSDHADGSMRVGIEDFGPVVAVLVWINVSVVALNREREPVRATPAAQGEGLL